jgi:hypothetical protein
MIIPHIIPPMVPRRLRSPSPLLRQLAIRK